MLNKIPFLYEENPQSFVSRLPFLGTEEYGAWLLHMAHVEGLECVDEVVFEDVEANDQGRFSKTSQENIMLAYNKLYAFNFLGHAWLELIRGRKIIPDEKEIGVLVQFLNEITVNGPPMGIPFDVIDKLYAEMQMCTNYMTVCEAICTAFIEQKYSVKDFERFLMAIEETDNEYLPTQAEVLNFYTTNAK
jgi:hypothetical protein